MNDVRGYSKRKELRTIPGYVPVVKDIAGRANDGVGEFQKLESASVHHQSAKASHISMKDEQERPNIPRELIEGSKKLTSLYLGLTFSTRDCYIALLCSAFTSKLVSKPTVSSSVNLFIGRNKNKTKVKSVFRYNER